MGGGVTVSTDNSGVATGERVITTTEECDAAVAAAGWTDAEPSVVDNYADWPCGCYGNRDSSAGSYNKVWVNNHENCNSDCTSSYQCLYAKDSQADKSFEVCDAFAAMREAALAAVMADRTCSPDMNCKDPTSGHACQVRRVDDPENSGEKINEYYCEIKTYDGPDTVENPATDEFPNGKFTSLGPKQVSACGDVTETSEGSGVFESKEICEAYGAMAEAGYSCVQETDCQVKDGQKCTPNADRSQYTCVVADGQTACTDVTLNPNDGLYYSKEVCDAFAAAEAARFAEIEALKTCSPSVNCVNPESGHACQVRVDAQGENEYYCQIRKFVDGDGSSATSDNPDGIFNGLNELESSSCTDVKLVPNSDPEKYESLEICATYGAKVEAGLTCVAEADCDSNGCVLDENDNNYKCVLTRETACTDATTDENGVTRSKEVCDAFAARKKQNSQLYWLREHVNLLRIVKTQHLDMLVKCAL